MAVSIGTGIYPPEKLGEVDFFSKGLFDLRGTLNRAKKLIKMLSTAVGIYTHWGRGIATVATRGCGIATVAIRGCGIRKTRVKW